MIRYYVTDRRQGDIITFARRAIDDGIDMIQVREKDLPARQLLEIVSRIRDLASGSNTKVLVNDRVDIAVTTGVSGVHLPANGLLAERVRPLVRVLGVSTHSVEDAIRAEKAGADFVVFGPIFETPGKTPAGFDTLRDVVAGVRLPVLAIGGVTMANADQVLDCGAAGIAGIRLFQSSV